MSAATLFPVSNAPVGGVRTVLARHPWEKGSELPFTRYKFTGPNQTAVHGTTDYPPVGEWSEPRLPKVCSSGWHVPTDLYWPTWFNAELWEVEVDGACATTYEHPDKEAWERIRFVKQVSRWTSQMAADFARDCARTAARYASSASSASSAARYASYASSASYARSASYAASYARSAARYASSARSASSAARSAAAAGSGGVYAERRRQADWLRSNLSLPALSD